MKKRSNVEEFVRIDLFDVLCTIQEVCIFISHSFFEINEMNIRRVISRALCNATAVDAHVRITFAECAIHFHSV